MTDDGKSISAAPSAPPEEGDNPASARAKPLPLRLPVVPQDSPAPALIPARMINEVLYCERLLYLEYVQGEWADNVYTADGQAVHRRVNEQVKALKPAPEEGETNEERPYVARSVWLSSERLGITAKIDLVEVDGGHVIPVEYKRSNRPDVPGGAYLPELAQVCAQVLLLREHGYTVRPRGNLLREGSTARRADHRRWSDCANSSSRRTRSCAGRVWCDAAASRRQPEMPRVFARRHLFSG